MLDLYSILMLCNTMLYNSAFFDSGQFFNPYPKSEEKS